jgi:Lon protease-like protein
MTRRPDRLPLLPLSDVVHFPRTRLGLDVVDPRHDDLLAELAARDEGDRWLGTVLVRPGGPDARGRRRIFPGGTAGRVVGLELRPDGGSRLALVGESRFTVTRELAERPFREAEVELVGEPDLRVDDAGVVAVRREIVDLVARLRAEHALGEDFPLDAGELLALRLGTSFEELVNRVAAGLPLPAVRKLALLVRSLPDRALELLAVLRGRERVAELLRPYRRPAGDPDLN